MAVASPFPRSHGRGRVLFSFLYIYHGRDGARTTRRSHHGRDNQGEMKNKSMPCSSRPRGEGILSAVAVTVTGVTMVA